MSNITETKAWADETHAQVFDFMSKQPKYFLKKHYEGFNECKLLNNYLGDIKGNSFFEIGCATGELYRYLSSSIPRFKYSGFDISAPAINRAKQKYPKATFTKLNSGFDNIVSEFGKPDVVWCRDVIFHQEDPYSFLNKLIDLSNEAVVLRVRTRDVGETNMDSNESCQLHWDKYWVPYIVLNTDEMVKKISERNDVKKIVISRSYEVLGGHNLRFLPKDLFLSNTKTAETAVFIQKGNANGQIEVNFIDQQDRAKYGIIERVILKIISLFN